MHHRSTTSALARAAAGTAAAWLVWRALRAGTRDSDLDGRTVLITGGSRGLGLLLAREFARHGCRIAICARDTAELDRARRDLEDRGADVLAHPCDVARQDDVHDLVRAVQDRFGPVDVLVNNAGIIQVGPLETMTLQDFQEAMATIFWGAVHPTLALLPSMRARRDGRIVNITSIGGRVAVPHLLPYTCAKFALVGFSEGLRAELARDGVSVTTVVPGLMRTGSPVNAFFKGKRAHEFTWFSLGDATPLTATSAPRAARRIVEAARRREADVTLTWQARLLAPFHGLFPGATANLLGTVNRLLPTADGAEPGRARGMELATPLSPSPLTALMNRAAIEYHQFAGRPEPAPEHARRIGLDGG